MKLSTVVAGYIGSKRLNISDKWLPVVSFASCFYFSGDGGSLGSQYPAAND
ncbi:MAG: hypothetical protein WDO19_20270 [Bacteroidota bacterium]